MGQSDKNPAEPQIFVLKQSPQESTSAFEARISDMTKALSHAPDPRPAIVYSVPLPPLLRSTLPISA